MHVHKITNSRDMQARSRSLISHTTRHGVGKKFMRTNERSERSPLFVIFVRERLRPLHWSGRTLALDIAHIALESCFL